MSRTEGEQEAWSDGYTAGQADEAEDAVREIQKQRAEAYEYGMRHGMVVGAAIIAWAEAIHVNFPCLQGGHFWGWSPGRNADVCQECGHVADENE